VSFRRWRRRPHPRSPSPQAASVPRGGEGGRNPPEPLWGKAEARTAPEPLPTPQADGRGLEGERGKEEDELTVYNRPRLRSGNEIKAEATPPLNSLPLLLKSYDPAGDRGWRSEP